MFCTRLPLLRADAACRRRASPRRPGRFRSRDFVVGLIGAVVYALAHRARTAGHGRRRRSAVAATLLATGCLHEDGLADTADGFGGGKTREQKLDIMRDSRIGAYGVCALAMSLVLRVGALASLPERACGRVGADRLACRRARDHAGIDASAAAGAQRRLVVRCRPAAGRGRRRRRGDRLSHSRDSACISATALLALIVLAVIVALMAWLSKRQIDGQTGDVLGALEQVSEIAILLVALG